MIEVEFVIKGTFYKSFDVKLPMTLKEFEILDNEYGIHNHIFDLLCDNDYLDSRERDGWDVKDVTIHEENDDRGSLLIEEIIEE